MEFTALTRERVRCYVYQLVDPRTETVFYVGKGTGDRVFQHLAGEVREEEESLKLRTINAIRELELEPRVRIVAHDLDDEKALLVEAVLIKQLGLGALSNRVHGHYADDLFLSVDDVESRYAARTVSEADLRERILLVSLNGGRNNAPFPMFQHDRAEVERRTLGDWRVAAISAARVELVAGVYEGVVRSVFDVRGPAGTAQVGPSGLPGRLRFRGTELVAHTIRLARIIGGDGDERTVFGPQQAFRYVGPTGG